MINELGDEHSFFLSPIEVEESEAELKGDIEFVGVGIYGQLDFERGRMVVISTFPGSPAEYRRDTASRQHPAGGWSADQGG